MLHASAMTSGSVQWCTVPLALCFSTQILPPWFSMMVRAMNNPGPVPLRFDAMNGSNIELGSCVGMLISGSEWSKQLAAQAVSRAVQEDLATLDDAVYGAASGVTCCGSA